MIMRYLLLALALSFSMVNAQRSGFANLDKSPLDMSYARPDRMSDPDLRVLYSRPQLKGRTLESLAPKGTVWRTGANETTEIIFYKDMKIQGTKIPAGTYSLYTIPGESDWKVILNKKLHTWGAYARQRSRLTSADPHRLLRRCCLGLGAESPRGRRRARRRQSPGGRALRSRAGRRR